MELRLFFYLFKIFYPKLKKIKINKNKQSLFIFGTLFIYLKFFIT